MQCSRILEIRFFICARNYKTVARKEKEETFSLAESGLDENDEGRVRRTKGREKGLRGGGWNKERVNRGTRNWEDDSPHTSTQSHRERAKESKNDG